jgi:hypothetical protein
MHTTPHIARVDAEQGSLVLSAQVSKWRKPSNGRDIDRYRSKIGGNYPMPMLREDIKEYPMCNLEKG